MSTLPAGTVIADRFELEAIAGSGGMGTVWRALDRQSGQKVGLKLLHPRDSKTDQMERFEREALMIAELSHPGIVAYVAHGRTLEGDPFLAMEWLDGEDLAARLRRGPLRVSETLTLLQKVAEALSTAHRRGIVHRDLKPSNLFLRDGKVEQATILDFGLARPVLGAPALTRSGVVMGTPGYMAPEQARGERDLGPSADIFSLGCVVYECCTGEPPFVAEHLVALLAKILFDAAPKARELRPEVPEALGALLDRMLAKDPSLRPRDAVALLSEQALLAEGVHESFLTTQTAEAVAEEALVGPEQQVFSVVIAVPPDADDARCSSQERRALESSLAAFHARLEWLADGSLITALSPSESATDLAAQAARCALVIQEHWPTARIALSTGRGVLRKRFPVGDAVDRAARIVRALPGEQTPCEDPRPESISGIWLDELSANLLEGRFALSQGPHGARLLGEAVRVDETRLLLGKPTPCVGRERELSFLEGTLHHCAEESGAQAVLVTAAPGVGKSRLRHELVRRLDAQGTKALILFGRGDLISKGSPYGLLSQALRRLCGVQSGDALAAQETRLRQCLEERMDSPDVPRIIDFLTEMCGVPFTGEPSARLRAARSDPRLMGEQISRAFVDWLRLECARCPVLFILEDLHWGDAPTVNLVDTALRELSNQPLMVLALGRPEVKDLFPRLFSARALKEIALSGLSRRASERLVQEVLGKEISAETVARIVEQSEGNALYLEELVRAVADGKGDELPETVLAMVQVRLSRFAPGARRILRSGSVFGETFWHGGVRALLGQDARPEELTGWLSVLVDAEVIEQRPESRFPSEAEYRFRHALMRDAAYSMLTEGDAKLGHRLASVYLEVVGERDAMILAEHAQRGGDLERAVPLFLRATEQAFACSDWTSVHLRAERGIECGARMEVLGSLRALQAGAYYHCLDLKASYLAAIEAITLLPRDSFYWLKAAAFLTVAAVFIGELAQFKDLASLLLTADPPVEACIAYFEAATVVSLMFNFTGQRKPANAILERMNQVGMTIIDQDATARGLLKWAHSGHVLFMSPDPWKAHKLTAESVLAFTQAEDQRYLAMAKFYDAMAQIALGERVLSQDRLRGALEVAQARDDLLSSASIKQLLAMQLFDPYGRADESQMERVRELLTDGLGNERSGGITRGYAHGTLARALLAFGDAQGAETEARVALDVLSMMPVLQPAHLPTLIYALLRQGRISEAQEVAKKGVELIDSLGGTGCTEVALRLAAAEASHAAGDLPAAESALRETLHQIQIRADTIPEPSARERFLSQVPENARTFEFARAWQVALPAEPPP